MFVRIVAAAFVACSLAASAMAKDASIVTLIISVPGSENADRVASADQRADEMQAALETFGAEILRTTNPNDAQLRSVLRRFAAVASNRDVSLIYLDAPVVQFEDRIFVLPDGFSLNRATDLFTRAVPLSGFGRAAAVSGFGGAVFVKPQAGDEALPPALKAVTTAPEALAGASPIVMEAPAAADAIARVIAGFAAEETVELGAMIRQMAREGGITVSAQPGIAVFLRQPDEPEELATAPTEETLTPVLAGSGSAAGEPVSAEVLAEFEQSISRSVKRVLQRGLRKNGFYGGLIDGIFGPQTRAGIIAYQADRGDPATGYLTERQIVELRKAAS